MKDRLLSLLFPPRCAFCGAFLRRGQTEVCARCMQEIRFVSSGCAKAPMFVDRCVGALAYKDRVRLAVHRFKFRGRQSAAPAFGRLVAHQVQAHMDEPFDFVTWVPTSERNIRRRGYDHARLLAEETARRLGLAARQTLRRVRHTRPMYGLGAAERRANVLDAFRAQDESMVKGARILLVDDILTTGSTLSECARVLREAGAVRVCGAVLAVTKKTRR